MRTTGLHVCLVLENAPITGQMPSGGRVEENLEK
jgi:hypothetical protein